MSDNRTRTNHDAVAAKKGPSKLMDDATYADFCSSVPDLEARYGRFIKIYYDEIDSGMAVQYRTPWKKLVMGEIPSGLTVDEWLSLVTNYKIKVRKAPKKVPAKPKQARTLFGPKPPTGQLKIF